jgi:hypothetical protein
MTMSFAKSEDRGMSTAELRVTYGPDDDGTGELVAFSRSGAFAGQGSAWVGRDMETFVACLRSFPLTAADPPTIEGGYWDGRGSLNQCHLRIIIKPYNSRGTLLVHVDIAAPVSNTRELDLQNRAIIRFFTEYAAVDIFADHLEQVLSGKREEAILKGVPV